MPKNWLTGDYNSDQRLNAVDLSRMKHALLKGNAVTSQRYVKTAEELKDALADAKAGDEIIVAEGEYVYTFSTAKGYMYRCDAS